MSPTTDIIYEQACFDYLIYKNRVLVGELSGKAQPDKMVDGVCQCLKTSERLDCAAEDHDLAAVNRCRLAVAAVLGSVEQRGSWANIRR